MSGSAGGGRPIWAASCPCGSCYLCSPMGLGLPFLLAWRCHRDGGPRAIPRKNMARHETQDSGRGGMVGTVSLGG